MVSFGLNGSRISYTAMPADRSFTLASDWHMRMRPSRPRRAAVRSRAVPCPESQSDGTEECAGRRWMFFSGRLSDEHNPIPRVLRAIADRWLGRA